MLFDPATGKGDRIRIKDTDGKRVRVFKGNGNLVGVEREQAREESWQGQAESGWAMMARLQTSTARKSCPSWLRSSATRP